VTCDKCKREVKNVTARCEKCFALDAEVAVAEFRARLGAYIRQQSIDTVKGGFANVTLQRIALEIEKGSAP
jgi:hypothetical protein